MIHHECGVDCGWRSTFFSAPDFLLPFVLHRTLSLASARYNGGADDVDQERWLEMISCVASKQIIALPPCLILGARQPQEECIALIDGVEIFT